MKYLKQVATEKDVVASSENTIVYSVIENGKTYIKEKKSSNYDNEKLDIPTYDINTDLD